MLAETDRRVRLAARAVGRHGLAHAYGHVSARLDDGHFLVCAPQPMATIESHTRGTVVPLEGPLPDGVLGEVRVHREIYRRRPDVGGICRVQPPRTTALAALGRTPRPLHGAGTYVPRPPLWDRPALVRDDATAAAVAEALADAAAIVLRGNGCVVTGSTIEAACVHAFFLEEAARLELDVLPAEAAGRGAIEFSADEIAERATATGGVYERMWAYLCSGDPEWTTSPASAPTTEPTLHDAAHRLAAAYRDGPIAPLRDDLADPTVERAYAVQAINTERWVAEGRVIVGAKAGLTSVAVQQQLGVDQPDFGVLFADMAVEDGGVVPAGRLLQPKVEAEVAFVMRRSPDVDRLTTAELIDSIDAIYPALEIVDSRIAGWDIGIVDTIADNASSGLFVLGPRPVAIGDVDLRLCGMVLERNGEPISFGAGAACLGHPLHAVAWLARTLAGVGRPLEAGAIVLSGALGPMVDARPGDTFETRIAGVGTARVGFASNKE